MNKDAPSLSTRIYGFENRLTPVPKRGKILRVKSGYNPNSSSSGSVVFLLTTRMLAFSASFGVAAGLIYSYFERKSGQKQFGSNRPERRREDR